MRVFTIILGLLLTLNIVNAQKGSRVRQVKMRYFEEKLELSSVEARKFWPIYNDYESRKNRLAAEKKNIMKFYVDNSSSMSDEEISQTLEKYIAIEKRETALLVKYSESFKQILPDEKVLKIYIVEVQFRNYLLKQLRTGAKSIQPRN